MITKILNVKIAPIFMVIDGQFLMDIYTMLNRSFLEYNVNIDIDIDLEIL